MYTVNVNISIILNDLISGEIVSQYCENVDFYFWKVYSNRINAKIE